MNAGNLAAWNIDPSKFPTTGTSVEKGRFAVSYAILAPSSHNTQPWQFIINGSELLVCADRTRSLPNIDPFDRELIISCGAALFNLRVALAYFNVPVEIVTFPQSSDPDIVARIAFPSSGPMFRDLADLFGTITKRVTNRAPFIEEDVPDVIIERLKSAAEMEGVDVVFAQTLNERERIAALIANPTGANSMIHVFDANLQAGYTGRATVMACRPLPRAFTPSPMPRRRSPLWLFAPSISVTELPPHTSNWRAVRRY